ncbi:hypothetical protein CcaverHIS002_0110480 [Cutaneotrichosporon cavernicola]|nr:hypothetical protein CcaverHIS002_0110480 [Cutaneotrichosporon cavernicola]
MITTALCRTTSTPKARLTTGVGYYYPPEGYYYPPAADTAPDPAFVAASAPPAVETHFAASADPFMELHLASPSARHSLPPPPV